MDAAALMGRSRHLIGLTRSGRALSHPVETARPRNTKQALYRSFQDPDALARLPASQVGRTKEDQTYLYPEQAHHPKEEGN